jgi:hypothetical protein
MNIEIVCIDMYLKHFYFRLMQDENLKTDAIIKAFRAGAFTQCQGFGGMDFAKLLLV